MPEKPKPEPIKTIRKDGTVHWSYGPSKGPPGHRPPKPIIAEPGNTTAEKHGAWSPRKVNPLAQELVERIADLIPYLAEDPTYRPAVWAWARAEARVQLLAEHIDERGPLDADGKPWPALDQLQKAEGSAARARERLGLDPLSRAKLGRDLADTRGAADRLLSHLDEHYADSESEKGGEA